MTDLIEKLDYRLAENFIADKLRSAGWNLLARNYRRIGCELDIIASKAETLIFVEVKSRKWLPIIYRVDEFISRKKKAALHRGALKYLSETDVNYQTIRFDAAIVYKKRPDENPVFDYYVDI